MMAFATTRGLVRPRHARRDFGGTMRALRQAHAFRHGYPSTRRNVFEAMSAVSPVSGG